MNTIKSFFKNEEPLGLPKGSVRALIAIAITVSVVVAMFLGIEVPGEVFGFTASIIGFYFGARAAEEITPK